MGWRYTGFLSCRPWCCQRRGPIAFGLCPSRRMGPSILTLLNFERYRGVTRRGLIHSYLEMNAIVFEILCAKASCWVFSESVSLRQVKQRIFSIFPEVMIWKGTAHFRCFRVLFFQNWLFISIGIVPLKPEINGEKKSTWSFKESRFDASKRYAFHSFLPEVLLKRQRTQGPNDDVVCFWKRSPDVTLWLMIVGLGTAELAQSPRTCRGGEI